MSEDGVPTAWSAPALSATDPDVGETLTWSVSAEAANGTATVSGTGASPSVFDYAPDANHFGTDTFSVRVDDGNGGVDLIEVQVSIEAVNDAPVIAQSASVEVTMDEDGVPTAWSAPAITASDADPSDTLTWSVSTEATNGTATVSGTGASPSVFDYTPDGDFFGADSFLVQVDDGNGGTDTILVNVTVTAQQDLPVIAQGVSVEATMDEDGAPTAWVAPALSASDADPSDTLTWSVSAEATHGTATVSGTGASPTVFDYAPDADFFGTDSFTVQVDDGNGGTDIILVNVSVEPINDVPVIAQGVSVEATMDEDGAPTAWVAPALSASDADPSDTLTWSVSAEATNGTATVSGTGASPSVFDYTPDGDFFGADSFLVQVDDGNGGTDIILVNVTVAPINDVPVIAQGVSVEATMDEDGVPTAWAAPVIVATDADPGDTLTWSVSAEATHGTATVSGTGASPTVFDYAPDADFFGTDSFTVQVDDGNGGADTFLVNVTVESINDAPVIAQGSFVGVIMDEDGAPTPWTAPLITANDADSTDTLTWSVSIEATHGAATVSGTGASPSIFDYAPDLDYYGFDSFTVNVDDGNGGADTIEVNVTVISQGDEPIIYVTNEPLAFGDWPVDAGPSAAQIMRFTNIGNVDLIISSIEISGLSSAEFTITSGGDPGILAPAATREVSVVFDPASIGLKRGELDVFTNDPKNPLEGVRLSGLGIAPEIAVAPLSLSLVANGIGVVSDPASLTIVNEGSFNLDLSAVTLAGASSTEFSIVGTPASPSVIAPGASREVQVTFGPVATAASVSAELLIGSSDFDEPLISVTLYGDVELRVGDLVDALLGVIAAEPAAEFDVNGDSTFNAADVVTKANALNENP